MLHLDHVFFLWWPSGLKLGEIISVTFRYHAGCREAPALSHGFSKRYVIAFSRHVMISCFIQVIIFRCTCGTCPSYWSCKIFL